MTIIILIYGKLQQALTFHDCQKFNQRRSSQITHVDVEGLRNPPQYSYISKNNDYEQVINVECNNGVLRKIIPVFSLNNLANHYDDQPYGTRGFSDTIAFINVISCADSTVETWRYNASEPILLILHFLVSKLGRVAQEALTNRI